MSRSYGLMRRAASNWTSEFEPAAARAAAARAAAARAAAARARVARARAARARAAAGWARAVATASPTYRGCARTWTL